jgi:hypothetical protein
VFSNRKSFQKKIINTYSFGGGAINDTVIQITNKKLPFGELVQVESVHITAELLLTSFHIKKALSKKRIGLMLLCVIRPITYP